MTALEKLVVPAKTSQDQRRASHPKASAWVSANAGSGKTKVLVDRVLRLLLEGAKPGRILCLTFTKAAAATMANRIFAELGRWVALDDEALSDTLTRLEGERPGPKRMQRARTLFAKAVETPGGLKIDTLHAFCERVLHVFPFEANVPAKFEVLDEQTAKALLGQAMERVLLQASREPQTEVGQAFAFLCLEAGGDQLEGLIASALKQKTFLRSLRSKALDTFQGVMDHLGRHLGLEAGETLEAIEERMWAQGLVSHDIAAIIEHLMLGKPTDHDRAFALIDARNQTHHKKRLASYLTCFFTKDGEPRKDGSRFVTKAIDAAIVSQLCAERDRLVALQDKRKAALCLTRTKALLTLADAIFQEVETIKGARGALDFDDLIDRMLNLLSRSDAAWVLFKLDSGIDHVLIDEAQDTSPEQWEIVKRLTEDFHAGLSAREDITRTIFAVGDPKQSIYGFQGAAPEEFEAGLRHYRNRLSEAKVRFEDVRLTLSFRSSPDILSAVDAVFGQPAHFRGLSFEAGAGGTVHESARPSAPGLVELWPLARPIEVEEPEAWVLPVDEVEQTAPPVRVAQRIARTVQRWTHEGDETGRLWKPGDILVLVRKRGPAFEAVIRAFKDAGVPVAGADRLDVAAHIAVQDLIAAGRAALLPQDDLSLACALKSPLVGLDDDDLIRIGAARPDEESLFDALKIASDQDDVSAQKALATVMEWRKTARTGGPFAFYAHLLSALGGRRALVARLGLEAADAIDAFLSAALSFEQRDALCLLTFLERFTGASHIIKREMDEARNEVRVMTVHGAKGLEAGAVFLIDGCDMGGRGDKLVRLTIHVQGNPVTLPVWAGAKDAPSPMATAFEAITSKELEEHNRLLYVAMTRAKDRLVVAPFIGRKLKEPRETAWSEMIRNGLSEAPQGLNEEEDGDNGSVWRWRASVPAVQPERPARVQNEPFIVPEWLSEPVTPEPEAAPPLKPSSALGAADGHARPFDGPFAAKARRRGVLIHALLERLPGLSPQTRQTAAKLYVKARGAGLSEEEREVIVIDALRIIEDERLRDLFGPDSRAETAIVGEIRVKGRSLAVAGQIDRLAMTDHAIWLADFKTSAHPPRNEHDIPQSHLTQLALYGALLRNMQPKKFIRSFLIWTSGALIMEIDPQRLEKALEALTP